MRPRPQARRSAGRCAGPPAPRRRRRAPTPHRPSAPAPWRGGKRPSRASAKGIAYRLSLRGTCRGPAVFGSLGATPARESAVAGSATARCVRRYRFADNAPMTLTELRYIVAVAREKHFGRAAEACFVSQPILCVAIKKLEEELDVKIFERGANEVSVTPLGETIVRQAQQVLEDAAEIKELAKRGKDPLAGPLKLGIIYTIGPYLLPDLVKQAIRLT